MRVHGEYEGRGKLQERGREEVQGGSSGRLPVLTQWEVHKTKRGMHMRPSMRLVMSLN